MFKPSLRKPLASLLLQRSKRLLMVGMLCLAASIALLKFSDTITGRARAGLAAAQARLNEADRLESMAIKEAERAGLAQALLKAAQAAGFSVREWDERRFNMKQVVMSREALNSLLNEVARSPGRLFAADQFDISVKRPDEGLFSTPKEPDSDLTVSLKGSLIFRAKRDVQ